MTTFLVEAYTPATAPIPEIERRVRAVAVELTRAGTPIRYVRSILLREDEVCLFLFETAACETVREASARAGLPAERIVEAVEGGHEPDGGTRPSRTGPHTRLRDPNDHEPEE